MLAAFSACNPEPTPAFTAEARGRGRALYRQHCALCHGLAADGRGLRREGLSSQPADFTRASFRARSSPRRTFSRIRDGVSGTAMPAWRALSDEETWDLVAYLHSVSSEGP